MSKKIHLALNVSNIAKSIDFYQALLGEKPVKREVFVVCNDSEGQDNLLI